MGNTFQIPIFIFIHVQYNCSIFPKSIYNTVTEQHPPPPPSLSLSPLFANTGKTIPSKNANFLAGIQHLHSKLDQLYTGQQGLASLMQEQDLHGKTLANWQHISVPTSHNV